MHFFGMFAPEARGRIMAQMGEGPWKGVYSLVSLIGLALMIYGWVASSNAPEEADFVYVPAAWARHAAMLLVLIGFILIGAAHGKGNIKLWVKQPMSIGIALWAIGHLLANGEKADIWLFGSILLLAVVDIIVFDGARQGPALRAATALRHHRGRRRHRALSGLPLRLPPLHSGRAGGRLISRARTRPCN